jgi:small subunit ribosomal protein S18
MSKVNYCHAVITGNSLKFQRKVSDAVKKARQMAILPYVTDLLK